MGIVFFIVMLVILIIGFIIYKAKKFRDFNTKIYRDEIRRLRDLNERP